MSEPVVLVKVSAGILVVTLNRPQVKNAVDTQVSGLLADAMRELDARPDLRVGILTGAGGNFSSGIDLAAIARGELEALGERGFAAFIEHPPSKPLIAAVEGYALAGGFEMVLACDLVVAAEGAMFGLPEVRRGLAAAGGGLLRLPGRLPLNVGMELSLTGGMLKAARAHDLGLVNRLVSPGTVLEAATELASTIAANAPAAVMASKRVLLRSVDWPADEGFVRQIDVLAPVFASPDVHEGSQAFLEKRDPVWADPSIGG